MHSLPATIAREIAARLCGLLPPPVTDTADARAARDAAALAAVEALHPADAFEAELAAQIVAADAHAKDCLRLAVQPAASADDARRCRAQAVSMMRQMQGGLRALMRRQAEQDKAETAMRPAAMERAGYWFRDVSVPAPEPEPASDLLIRAEGWAAAHIVPATRIRALGGMPPHPDFEPPPPDILAILVTGGSAILRALDGIGREDAQRT
ncbi:MAG: hypothetical protein WDN25_10080 [Acetobacteraceae bacterium]